ncbi:hypothetical protein [Arenimonas sp. GDDSR-1]|uniref:hypothetical protein n=1 Tax=Arenimonas sp. GDDSR-1 TaxID=2950125 RepID=UPI00262797DF|nr:hypothetical protein [Arenimonas sp. GDDSR-1]
MRLSQIHLHGLALAMIAGSSCLSAQDGNVPDFKVGLNINGCQFSGGTDGYGNVEVMQKTGGKKIQVEVLYGDDLVFEPTSFKGPGSDQLREAAGGNGNVLNIFNANTGPADVYYQINLRNKQTGELLSCDPRVINK